jgi:hypothetical protein
VERAGQGIYPMVTFEAQPSEHIPMLRADPALKLRIHRNKNRF